MAIYTRGGDSGETGLSDGTRTSKASARVEAYGALDEAGALIGFARLAVGDRSIDTALCFAQQRLFNCGAALANPGAHDVAVDDADVAYLERAIDALQERVGGWRGFVVASGSEASVRLHMARAVTRRAERRIVTLAEQAPVDPPLLAFVNRLSDLLFASASAAAAYDGVAEEPWLRDTRPPID
jgi:cob(I)alamin adenosyltransferase